MYEQVEIELYSESAYLQLWEFIQRIEEAVIVWPKRTVAISGLRLSPDEGRALPDGQELSFSKREVDLLYYLVINRGRVLTHMQICEAVWRTEPEDYENVVQCAISKILEANSRLAENGDNPDISFENVIQESGITEEELAHTEEAKIE